MMIKKYHNVRDHCHWTGKYKEVAHSVYNETQRRNSKRNSCGISKEIPIVFHKGSTYDCHFIIKELAKEFEGQFECLGEKYILRSEIYFIFSVPIKKELDNGKIITYKLKFIDSFRFIPTSLSKLSDNLSGIYSKEYRDKNCESEFKFKGLRNNKLSYICKECRKKQLKPLNGLIKNFWNTYKYCNNDINKFIMLLRKVVYPYEYMDI